MKFYEKLIILIILFLGVTIGTAAIIGVYTRTVNENDSQNQTLAEQQEEFGINDFIQESEQYTGEFFEDIDINEILQDALKGEINNETCRYDNGVWGRSSYSTANN